MNVQDVEVIPILDSAADAAGRNSRAISLKNYTGVVRLSCTVNQGNAATVLFTPQQCTAIDGSGGKALSADVPIYTSSDLATTTVLTRETAAKNFTTSAATTSKIVHFLIDPASLDVAGGFDCIRVVTGASNAANITAASAIVQAKHKGDVTLNARAN
jgi:hypothetical protein